MRGRGGRYKVVDLNTLNTKVWLKNFQVAKRILFKMLRCTNICMDLLNFIYSEQWSAYSMVIQLVKIFVF